MSWLDHLLSFLFGIVFPLVAVNNARSGGLQQIHFDTKAKKLLYYSNSLMLWGMALLVLVCWWWQGRSFGQLGLQWGQLPFSTYAWSLLGSFVVLYGADILMETASETRRDRTRSHFQRNVGFLPTNVKEYSHFVFLAFTAGICEEIVFRGYFISYLRNILPDTVGELLLPLAIIIPALVFAVAHLYQGWKAVVKIIAMAILFGAFFVETRMLWPLILIHVVVDLIGGLVSWYLYMESDE